MVKLFTLMMEKIDRQFNAKDGYAIKHAISKGI